MAWTVTSRGTVQLLNSAANTAVTVTTPNAGKLLLAWFSGIANPTAVSGCADANGWSQIGSSQAWDTGNQSTLRFYASKASGSGTSITFTHSGAWYRAAGVIEIDETVAGLPTAVASCFGTPVGTAIYLDGSNPHTFGPTLAAFADSTNLTVIVGTSNGGSTFNCTPDTGYTEAHEVGTSDVQGALEYIASADTTPTVVTNTNFQYAGTLAVEVKKATAGGATSKLLSMLSNQGGF